MREPDSWGVPLHQSSRVREDHSLSLFAVRPGVTKVVQALFIHPEKTRPFSSRCQSSADTRPRRHRANTESWSGFWSRIVALPCPGCLMTILSGRFRVSIAFRRSASTSNKSRRAVVLSRPRCSMLDQLPRAAMWYTRRYRVQRSTTSTFLPPLPAIDETQAPSASDRSLAARRFRAQLPRSAELPQDARNSNRAVGLLKVL